MTPSSIFTSAERSGRGAAPKAGYEVVIIGADARGLATAHHLAKDHGIRDVAVLAMAEEGRSAAARPATLPRPSDLEPPLADLHALSRALMDRLPQELGVPALARARGLLALAQSPAAERACRRAAQSARVNGIDARWIDAAEARRRAPLLAEAAGAPVRGALWRPRAMLARAEALAPGYAASARALGVDVIAHAAVEGIDVVDGRVARLRTARGEIETRRVGLIAAGRAGAVAALAGFRLPLRPAPWEALISEPVRPCLDVEVCVGAAGLSLRQQEDGALAIALAADPDPDLGGGGLAAVAAAAASVRRLFPSLSRLRVARRVSGAAEATPDRAPLMGRSPVEGLFLNCGWVGDGGETAPASGCAFAATLARGAPDPVAAPFGLERFDEGGMIGGGLRAMAR